MYAEKVSQHFYGDKLDAYIDRSGALVKKQLYYYITQGNVNEVEQIWPEMRNYLFELFDNSIQSAKSGMIFTWAEINAIVQLEKVSIDNVVRILQPYFVKLDELTESDTVNDTLDLMYGVVMEFTEEIRVMRKKENCSPLIKKCCAYIRENITEELSLDSISAEMHFSNGYLSRKFREEMEMSVKDYIQKERISKAKELLDAGLPLLEISETLNFSSQSHFTKAFRKETGITPKVYQTNHK